MRVAALGRVRARLLLPHRPVGGVDEPPRYDRVRYGPRAEADGGYCGANGTRPGFGTSPSAGSCRARTHFGRVLRRVLRPGAEGADADRARARCAVRAVRLVVSPTSPMVAFPLGARTTTPAMYLSDILTIPPTWPARLACRSRAGSRRASPWGSSSAGRSSGQHAVPRWARPRAGPRFRLRGGARAMTLGDRDPPRDPRPSEDAHEAVLPLVIAYGAAANARRAPSASAIPARCRCRTARPSR